MAQRRWTSIAAAFSMVACPAPALAEDEAPKEPEVAPDRPDASDGTATVEPGWSQLELGVAVSSVTSKVTSVGTPFVLRTGLSESIELRLGGDGLAWQSVNGASAAGFGDLSMGFKIRFFEEGTYYPSIGVEPILIVPVASRADGLGSGRPTFLGTLMISKDFPAKFHADANVAVNAVGLEGEADFFPQGLASLSVSRGFLDGALTPFWEIYGLTKESPTDDLVVSTDFGVLIQVHKRIAIDAAADIGLNKAAPRVTGTVGVSFLLGRMF